MSLVLVCPPVIIVERKVPVMTVNTCRLAAIYPSNNNVYQVEIIEAPPVEIDYHEEVQEQEDDSMVNFVKSHFN